MLDSTFELKCLYLYINDYFIGVIIDIGRITSNKNRNKVQVAISSRQCLRFLYLGFFFNFCRRFFILTLLPF